MPAFALSPLPALRRPLHVASARTPRCAATQPAQPSRQSKARATLSTIEQRLVKELPPLFTSTDPDYSIYAEDVSFEDPLNKFRGTGRYRANIRLLTNSPIFSGADFHLHSSGVLPPQPAPGVPDDEAVPTTVRTRWTLTLCFSAAPWRPRPAFTGQSDYVVDLATGLVTRHVDYWDSLSADGNTFPSPRALADFVTQCSPGSAHPQTLPPRLLLRRTAELEVWRFDSEVRLTQPQRRESSSGTGDGEFVPFTISVQRTVEDVQDVASTVVQNVAAIRIGSVQPSAARVDEVARRLKRTLANVPYAVPTEEAVCVAVPSGRGSAVEHYVWLVLSDASAPIDY